TLVCVRDRDAVAGWRIPEGIDGDPLFVGACLSSKGNKLLWRIERSAMVCGFTDVKAAIAQGGEIEVSGQIDRRRRISCPLICSTGEGGYSGDQGPWTPRQPTVGAHAVTAS